MALELLGDMERSSAAPSQNWHEHKKKAATSLPGKFLDALKVADLDFKSTAGKQLSYNSLSSWGAESPLKTCGHFTASVKGRMRHDRKAESSVDSSVAACESPCCHSGDTP